MRISTYFERLLKKDSGVTYTEGMIQAETENGQTVCARIADISEYGCSFEVHNVKAYDLFQSRTVRIQWENLSEGILSTVVQKNEETGFIVVRFEKMSNEQYVQLLEFAEEMGKKATAFGMYGAKVS
ncbi:MAG: hypothetical protein ACOYU3_04315 [Bacillota bacterium]